MGLLEVAEAHRAPPHTFGQLLQMAVAIPVTGSAVAVMGGQEKFQQHTAVSQQIRCVGPYAHTVTRSYGTGCEVAPLVITDGTEAACAVNGEFGYITECRQVDACFPDNRQYVVFIGEFDADAVDEHEAHKISP